VNHIVGYCELLLEELDGDAYPAAHRALNDSLAAVREALSLINSALPSSGRDVTSHDVESLSAALRQPHSIIRAALSSILAGNPDPQVAADVAKISKANDRLLHGHNPPSAQPETIRVSQTAEHPAAKGRILVVDDVAENRDVLVRHLSKQGYSTETAMDGMAALDAIRARSFDLVLLDVRMPGIDGYQVLEQIKHDPATRDVPVVMISAADDLDTITACIEAGAEDFLPKPFDTAILRARVNASVEKKRLRNLEIDYLHQVDRVIDAANAVERGSYSPGFLADIARRDDALGRLARVFDSMAEGMRAREDRLKEQVDVLKREVTAARQETPSSGVELDSDTLIPGETFTSRYRITRVVGRGGMGTVYKAADNDLGEDVAIKLLKSEAITSDPAMAERFKNEIKLARRISHRNVVRTHDFGERDGSYYVTMEYVEGITLRDLIDTRKHLSSVATLGIARQLAAALAVAHQEGVIHRDIKPQNLLLDAAGVLKVMDFGIARLTERPTAVTQAGMVVGTPAYMSPEQLLDENVDARSDLYSAGIVLYECLTGALPFEASSPIALIAKVLNTAPAAPAERTDDVSLPLSSLVMRLISKNPAERPQSADELGEMLAQIE
jgi:CheY-like chemotaxis protein